MTLYMGGRSFFILVELSVFISESVDVMDVDS